MTNTQYTNYSIKIKVERDSLGDIPADTYIKTLKTKLTQNYPGAEIDITTDDMGRVFVSAPDGGYEEAQIKDEILDIEESVFSGLCRSVEPTAKLNWETVDEGTDRERLIARYNDHTLEVYEEDGTWCWRTYGPDEDDTGDVDGGIADSMADAKRMALDAAH